MVTYRYTARDAAGRKVRGVARAADPQALYTQLRAAGLFLTGQRAGRAGGWPARSGRMPCPASAAVWAC